MFGKTTMDSLENGYEFRELLGTDGINTVSL